MPKATIQLERFEIQTLVMIAKNRSDPKSRGLLTDFPLSKDAVKIGTMILDGAKGRGKHANTARVFIRRGEARTSQAAAPLRACDMPDYLDSVQLGARLAMLGNGAALVYWNGDYTVSLLEPAMRNSSRRVLACGNIGKALFDRADARLAELRKLGAVK